MSATQYKESSKGLEQTSFNDEPLEAFNLVRKMTLLLPQFFTTVMLSQQVK